MLYTGGYEPRTCTSSAFYPPCAFRLRTVFCERTKCAKRFARDHSRRALERPAHVGLVRGANRCTRRPPRRGSGETGYYVAGYSVASGEYRALRRDRKCRAAGGRGMWGRISLYDERGIRLHRRGYDHPLYPRRRFHGPRVAPCRNDASSPTSICVRSASTREWGLVRLPEGFPSSRLSHKSPPKNPPAGRRRESAEGVGESTRRPSAAICIPPKVPI